MISVKQKGRVRELNLIKVHIDGKMLFSGEANKKNPDALLNVPSLLSF